MVAVRTRTWRKAEPLSRGVENRWQPRLGSCLGHLAYQDKRPFAGYENSQVVESLTPAGDAGSSDSLAEEILPLARSRAGSPASVGCRFDSGGPPTTGCSLTGIELPNAATRSTMPRSRALSPGWTG